MEGFGRALRGRLPVVRVLSLLAISAGVLLLGVYAALYENPQGEALIYTTAGCGCCYSYAEYLAGARYEAVVVNLSREELESLKAELGVPKTLWSCHTAIIGGYVVEGHVPVESIGRLVNDRPAIDGISVPGMPLGSPGMSGEPGSRASTNPELLVVYGFSEGNIRVFDIAVYP